MSSSKTASPLKGIFEPAKAQAAQAVMQPLAPSTPTPAPAVHLPPETAKQAVGVSGFPVICPSNSAKRYVMR